MLKTPYKLCKYCVSYHQFCWDREKDCLAPANIPTINLKIKLRTVKTTVNKHGTRYGSQY